MPNVNTINVTPSWRGLVHYMLAAYAIAAQRKDNDAMQMLHGEFETMALAADIGVKCQKEHSNA